MHPRRPPTPGCKKKRKGKLLGPNGYRLRITFVSPRQMIRPTPRVSSKAPSFGFFVLVLVVDRLDCRLDALTGLDGEATVRRPPDAVRRGDTIPSDPS